MVGFDGFYGGLAVFSIGGAIGAGLVGGAAGRGGGVVEFELVDFGVVAGVAGGDAAADVGLVSDAFVEVVVGEDVAGVDVLAEGLGYALEGGGLLPRWGVRVRLWATGCPSALRRAVGKSMPGLIAAERAVWWWFGGAF